MQIISWSTLTDRGRISQSLARPVLGTTLEGATCQPLVVMQTAAKVFPCGCWVITGNIVILWQGVKGSRLHLPAGGIAGEKKRGGRRRTEQIKMRGFLLFWLLARGVSFFSIFFYHCLPYWPWACEANHATKASRGRFNIISLTETSDLFLYVEHEEMWNCMPSMQTHCHLTHIHLHTLSSVC